MRGRIRGSVKRVLEDSKATIELLRTAHSARSSVANVKVANGSLSIGRIQARSTYQMNNEEWWRAEAIAERNEVLRMRLKLRSSTWHLCALTTAALVMGFALGVWFG